MKSILLIVLGMFVLAQPLAAEEETPTDTTVTIVVGPRHAHVAPTRRGFTHTGAGNVHVAQPSADTIVVTMTGVAVAGGFPCKDSMAALQFCLEQYFEVVVDKPEVTTVKLSVEARVSGFLRSHQKGGGVAQQGPASVIVDCGQGQVLVLDVPPHGVMGGQNLSVNCHEGPATISIAPGKYALRGTWGIQASYPPGLLPCKAASAEFAPEPALDPLWISDCEPYKGADKTECGLQVTLRVAPDSTTIPLTEVKAEPAAYSVSGG